MEKPKLFAVDTNDTYVPVLPIDGCELAPFPGMIPSGDDTRYVVGVHVVVVDGGVRGVVPLQMVRR